MTPPSQTTTQAAAGASDIRRDHWTLRLSPAPLRPYLRLARLDRPIGTWLLLFPCWWGLGLAAAAAGAWPNWLYVLLFAIGALVMRGAGCTYNDLVDRDFDAKVARTATRPIPSGEVTPRRAVVFMGLQMLVGLAVLLQFNGFSILLGLASLALVFTYPFMKRITYWPQAWLGLTFNWGALMGWAVLEGSLALPAILLYAAGIAWTLGYDTIYAHQDKEDDALIGVKSTALKFGAASKPWIVAFYAVTVALLAAAGLAAGLGMAYLVACAAVAVQLAWQVRTLDIDDPQSCIDRFRSNRWTGWLLCAGCLAETALA
ncbi:MAG: 4-hydroxybenzoate octaprenyltransferase [Kiloniellales bacterium]|nr:4-hydroxybenzoate octaprenyltransferase [Kiloniellales bacterium]